MKFLEYLKETYGLNKPIFISEIKYEDKSPSWIGREVRRLCREEKLLRYSRGIYYVPVKSLIHSGYRPLDDMEIIKKKYIYDNKNRFGFFTRNKFANDMHFTTQVPSTMEICTNKTSVSGKTVYIGWHKAVLYKPKTDINNDNFAVLRLLEGIEFAPSDFYNEKNRDIIEDYIRSYNITRKDISIYSRYFSKKVLHALIESEIIYLFLP